MSQEHIAQRSRLAPSDGQVIDQEAVVQFTFDGQRFEAYQGDTIASALMAAGQRILSRSFKYHRPRGVLCASGDCPNCLVQVGDEPNVRACTRSVEPGMKVQSQNRWPSLSFDIMRSIELVDRFLPAGFYYKTFMRPRVLWPAYEGLLRRAAGLGRVGNGPASWRSDKSNLHTDVMVVGGGPAGIQAALSAASAGAQVLLIEKDSHLGGHLRYRRSFNGRRPHSELLMDLIEAIGLSEDIEVLSGTAAFGVYEHGLVGAHSADTLYKIRTGSLVVATGAIEIPLLFENNDLPGVMLSGAAQRLLKLWGVVPGQRAVVTASHLHGWSTALELIDAGTEVAAVAVAGDAADAPELEELRSKGVSVLEGATVLQADGRRELEAVLLDLGSGKQPARIACDLLVASAGFTPANGLLYQAGASFLWTDDEHEHKLARLPNGVFAAGEVTGTHELRRILAGGKRAGLEAAEELGLSASPSWTADGDWGEERGPTWAGNMPYKVSTVGKKPFVCLCEDVTRRDLWQSSMEGYERAELLKRYSTVSMGPCQGKMCNLAVMQIGAYDAGRSVHDTSPTTSRPPANPVPLRILAGRPMEPVRLTPINAWHRQQGARMMVAGLWMRPEHYGDPDAEVRAVRERVGIIDVSTLGKFLLHGPGAPDLLERVYINRWRKLDIGRVRYGVMVNEEGVVMDDGVTARMDRDSYYMSATSSGAESVFEWCQWWLQSGWDLGVHMVDVTEERAAMNLAGPAARKVLRKLTSGVDLSNEAFPYMHVREAYVAGAPALLLRIGFTGELAYEIHTPSHFGLHVWQELLEAGREHGIMPFGVEAQRVLRLEKGHLIVGQDTDSLSNAFEAGLGWAVKFAKEDFLGKPSLQLAHDRGESRRLVGFEMIDDAQPEEAHQIVQEGGGPLGLEIIGRITSVRRSPTLGKTIGLAWVTPEMSEAGVQLSIRVNGALKRAVVVNTPFYDPAGNRLRS